MLFNKERKSLLVFFFIILSFIITICILTYYCFNSLELKDIHVDCKEHIDVGKSGAITIYTYYANNGILPDKIVNSVINLKKRYLEISLECKSDNLKIENSPVYLKDNEIMYVYDGISNGNERIKVTVDDIQKEIEVVCGVLQPEKIETPKQLLVECDGKASKRVRYVIYPKYADDTVTFYSSDDNIIKVDNAGNVFGVSKGKADIVAKTSNGLISKTEVLSAVLVNSFKLRQQNITVRKGTVFSIGYDILPQDVSYYSEVSWEIEDESLLKQLSDGVFEAISSGTTTITATVESEEVFVSTCIVTIF